MTIGERIQQRRIELNMTQEELAKKIGYTNKSTIARIETGTNQLRQSKIYEIAKALDTTPGYIMGWEDEEPSKEENLTPEMARLIAMITRNKIISQYVEKLFKLNERDRSIVFSLIDSMTEKESSIPVLRNEQNQE